MATRAANDKARNNAPPTEPMSPLDQDTSGPVKALTGPRKRPHTAPIFAAMATLCGGWSCAGRNLLAIVASSVECPHDSRMSRSRKKTPKLGFSSSVSEKQDKLIVHRKARRGASQVLKKREEGDAITGEHKRSGGWNFAKDGKRWVKKPRAQEMRK